MDDLLEQERQIRASMTSRAGVLGLMLHSTYNHEVIEELCRAAQIKQQQDQNQQSQPVLYDNGLQNKVTTKNSHNYQNQSNQTNCSTQIIKSNKNVSFRNSNYMNYENTF